MAGIATSLNLGPATRRVPTLVPDVDAAVHPAPVRFRIGPFELDPKSGELTNEGNRLLLQSQPLTLLLMLIEHGGEVVTRSEIEKRIWGDDVIVDFDRSINQLVRKLRRALNDSAEAPAYIETLASRGYRLKVRVEMVRGSTASVETTNGSKLSLSTLPAVSKDSDYGERASLSQSSPVRLQYVAGSNESGFVAPRAFRCRRRASYNWEQCRNNPAPLRVAETGCLSDCLASATLAEKLDALQQLLGLLTQDLERLAATSEPLDAPRVVSHSGHSDCASRAFA